MPDSGPLLVDPDTGRARKFAYAPGLVVVDGGPPQVAAAQRALDEARRLATVISVPVEMHDERRTTVSADRSMMEAGLDAPARRQRVDMVAAAIMLQSWLDGRR